MPEKLLFTAQETGQTLGIGRSMVYRLIARGDLRTVHIGKAMRIPVSAITAFADRLEAEQRGGE